MSGMVEKETTTGEAAVTERTPSCNEPKWYVAHTYSGYENKVKSDIEKTIENRNLKDQILEVLVPVQDVVEVKNGVKKTVSRKIFPGYVLVNMYMNDATWYIVRNTRGVTGFVGPESKPVPLTEAEMRTLGINVSEVKIDVSVTLLRLLPEHGKATPERLSRLMRVSRLLQSRLIFLEELQM